MGREFKKCLRRGGQGGVGQVDNCVTIFQKCYYPDKQVILNLTCINIFATTASKTF
jgi:hypothetical protein